MQRTFGVADSLIGEIVTGDQTYTDEFCLVTDHPNNYESHGIIIYDYHLGFQGGVFHIDYQPHCQTIIEEYFFGVLDRLRV